MTRFSLGSFIGGFMLGIIFAGVIMVNGDTSLLPLALRQSPRETATSTPNALPESGAVSVADQKAGDTVTVESVTVPPPGVWAAVREMTNGELGNVLGAARVTGPHTGVTIDLLRSTLPGTSYAIELYRDDGDSAFNLETDSVYVDFATGQPVVAYFTTTN